MDGVNGYTCTCAVGYTGAQCQTGFILAWNEDNWMSLGSVAHTSEAGIVYSKHAFSNLQILMIAQMVCACMVVPALMGSMGTPATVLLDTPDHSAKQVSFWRRVTGCAGIVWLTANEQAWFAANDIL